MVLKYCVPLLELNLFCLCPSLRSNQLFDIPNSIIVVAPVHRMKASIGEVSSQYLFFSFFLQERSLVLGPRFCSYSQWSHMRRITLAWHAWIWYGSVYPEQYRNVTMEWLTSNELSFPTCHYTWSQSFCCFWKSGRRGGNNGLASVLLLVVLVHATGVWKLRFL